MTRNPEHAATMLAHLSKPVEGWTPGEWRQASDAQGPFAIMHPTQSGVAIAVLDNAYKPANGFVEIGSARAPERTANFHLLFAAPELYEALKTLDDFWKRDFPRGPDYPSILSDDTVLLWKQVRTALAKARGETP